MEWTEVDSVPQECRNCREQDCYNCDNAGERWSLSRKDELRARRKILMKAIERLQRQIQIIDQKLS